MSSASVSSSSDSSFLGFLPLRSVYSSYSSRCARPLRSVRSVLCAVSSRSVRPLRSVRSSLFLLPLRSVRSSLCWSSLCLLFSRFLFLLPPSLSFKAAVSDFVIESSVYVVFLCADFAGAVFDVVDEDDADDDDVEICAEVFGTGLSSLRFLMP